MIPESRPARIVRPFVALAFLGFAVLLAVSATVLPLFRTVQPTALEDLNGTFSSVTYAWWLTYSFPGQDEEVAPAVPVGFAIVLASALLLAAFVLEIRRQATGRGVATARRTTLAAAAFLLGAVCVVGAQGLPRFGQERGLPASTSPQAGIWALLAAAALAVVATVLSHRGAGTEPDGVSSDAVDDAPTPPYGVAITVLPPERD